MDGKTSIIERSHFPDEVVARALSLSAAGYSSYKAQRLLAEEYGQDSAPGASTLQVWFRELGDSVHEEAPDRERRIMALCDDLLAEGLDYLQGKPGEIVKAGMMVNAVRGTMADKQFRREQGSSTTIHGPFVIALFPNDQAPAEVTTIDAEAARIE